VFVCVFVSVCVCLGTRTLDIEVVFIISFFGITSIFPNISTPHFCFFCADLKIFLCNNFSCVPDKESEQECEEGKRCVNWEQMTGDFF